MEDDKNTESRGSTREHIKMEKEDGKRLTRTKGRKIERSREHGRNFERRIDRPSLACLNVMYREHIFTHE